MKLLSCLAIRRDPVGLLLYSRLWSASIHGPYRVLQLLDNDLLLMVSPRYQHLLLANYACPVTWIIYSVRGSEYLVPLTPLCPRFLNYHLLAVQLLDGSYVLLVHVLILIRPCHARVHDSVCSFILRGLSCWCSC